VKGEGTKRGVVSKPGGVVFWTKKKVVEVDLLRQEAWKERTRTVEEMLKVQEEVRGTGYFHPSSYDPKDTRAERWRPIGNERVPA